MKNTNLYKNQFDKRQFYNDRDSGLVFLITLVTTFLLALLFSLIASTIATSGDVDVNEVTGSYAYTIPYAICSSLMYVIIYFIYNKTNKIRYNAVNVHFDMKWQTYLLLVCIGVVSLFGLQYFIGGVDQILSAIGYPLASEISIVNPTNWGLYILAIFVLAILPAICEELLFRGVILNGLRSRFNDVVAVVVSALMFALMHESLQQFVYPFLLGMIMGWVAIRTGSTISSMIVHFVNNFLVVTFAFIQNMTGFSIEFIDVWWFYLIAILLLVVTFGIYFVTDKYYFKGESKEKRERTSNKTSVLVYISIGVSFALLLIVTISKFVSGV